MRKRDFDFDTRIVHAGQSSDPTTGSRAPPLYQTTSYVFETADQAADLFALEAEGNVYSRFTNPTVSMLEQRLASLENGVDAVATASGLAALDVATFLLADVGDNVVSAGDLYGGTRSYLTHTAGRRGVEARFVETLDREAYANAIDDDTAYVHVETIGNPSLLTPDLSRIARIAHDAGVPLLVDNTFATPALCRPLDHGADIVWYSTTKWIHGAGTTLGGALIDGGTFEWDDSYPEIGAPNPAVHDLTFADRFGERAFAAAARHRGLRSLGNVQAPFDAWQTVQGLETLSLRMKRHCENARVVATFLRDREDVAWVSYPGFADHPSHDNASRHLDDFGGMIAFGLEGGYEAGRCLCESVELVSFLANIGDAKTLMIHPASTTHAQLTEHEQRASGVTPDLLRLSVGIEDPADIIADLEQAIDAAIRSVRTD